MVGIGFSQFSSLTCVAAPVVDEHVVLGEAGPTLITHKGLLPRVDPARKKEYWNSRMSLSLIPIDPHCWVNTPIQKCYGKSEFFRVKCSQIREILSRLWRQILWDVEGKLLRGLGWLLFLERHIHVTKYIPKDEKSRPPAATTPKLRQRWVSSVQNSWKGSGNEKKIRFKPSERIFSLIKMSLLEDR